MTAEIEHVDIRRVVVVSFGVGYIFGVHIEPDSTTGVVTTNDLTTTTSCSRSSGGVSEQDGVGIR